MTAWRRRKKDWLENAAGRAAATGLAFAVVAFGASSHAATTERTVTDRHTGLAVGGHDPIAYFTNDQARAGRSDLEVTFGGAVWRFANESHRAFFLADPEVYRPQFGGYDPVDVARGVAVAGHPQFWIVHDQRLYLFARPESRQAFLASPIICLESARRVWPRLADGLVN